MSQKNIYLELTPLTRIRAVTLIVTQYVLYFASILLLVNYFVGLPFVPYPSMASTTNITPHYLNNILLYLLFWTQHIVMATLWYKVAWVKQWNYFPLFDRYIYNIASGVCLAIMLVNLQPCSIFLFEIPLIICIPCSLMGAYFLVQGVRTLGGGVMMPFKLKKIMNDRQVQIVLYQARRHTNLITTGIYGQIRHPMQSGVLILLMFGWGVYTTERLLFVGVMGLFVLIGVTMEQRRLCRLQKGYPDYQKTVKARFIPYLF